jgi:hypothetical protein
VEGQVSYIESVVHVSIFFADGPALEFDSFRVPPFVLDVATGALHVAASENDILQSLRGRGAGRRLPKAVSLRQFGPPSKAQILLTL